MEVIDLSPEQCVESLNDYVLIDVRTPEEFIGELGHIKNSNLLTIADDFANQLAQYSKDKKILFICRSGNRSGTATAIALQNGYEAYNLGGGMIRWNELGYEVER